MELDEMLIIHFQERIDWMNIIYADYNIYHNSIDICTYAEYILRIDCSNAEKGQKTKRRIPMKEVQIYTDGACSGNPGPGGYGAILKYGKYEKEICGGDPNTTNNRMELMGAIVALQALKEPCEVVLTTDSKYVIDGITKWIFNWKSKNWPSHVVNKDLWIELEKQKL